MSHVRLKTKYKTEGAFGTEEEFWVYADLDASCDCIDFYDYDGTYLLTIADTINGNLLDSINKLVKSFNNDSLQEGVEITQNDEVKKCRRFPGKR